MLKKTQQLLQQMVPPPQPPLGLPLLPPLCMQQLPRLRQVVWQLGQFMGVGEGEGARGHCLGRVQVMTALQVCVCVCVCVWCAGVCWYGKVRWEGGYVGVVWCGGVFLLPFCRGSNLLHEAIPQYLAIPACLRDCACLLACSQDCACLLL